MDLADIAADLYAAVPEEFVAKRNAAEKQAKADGDRELAASIKALAKPSAAAWVVNMMTREMASEMDQLMAVGDSLREAQDEVDAAQLRQLSTQRRQLTTAFARQGRMKAADLGHPVSAAVGDQVQETLHAAVIDEEAAAAVRSGMLITTLSASGLDSVETAAAVAVPSVIGKPAPRKPPKLRVVKDDGAVARQKAKEALEEAEAAAADAQRHLDEKDTELDEAQQGKSDAEQRVDELREELSVAERDVRAADKQLARAKSERTAAAENAEKTEKRATEVREALAKL